MDVSGHLTSEEQPDVPGLVGLADAEGVFEKLCGVKSRWTGEVLASAGQRAAANAKINRNFEVFTATDFLAAITQHIPDKGAQMVRYYGWYSNKMRGLRHRGLPPDLVPRRPGLSPPPPLELPSKRWRDLVLRVWHVDPLGCPVCQNPMRVIAVIDDPWVVEQILRHLGAWHDPPPRTPPQGLPGPYTYEPCEDVDPTTKTC
jgi:hypothetical protein